MMGAATPPITSKTERFVPIRAMEDIGTKDDWAPAQRGLILSGVPKVGRQEATPSSSFPAYCFRANLCQVHSRALRVTAKLNPVSHSHCGGRAEQHRK